LANKYRFEPKIFLANDFLAAKSSFKDILPTF
jgi:hypothetical protein